MDDIGENLSALAGQGATNNTPTNASPKPVYPRQSNIINTVAKEVTRKQAKNVAEGGEAPTNSIIEACPSVIKFNKNVNPRNQSWLTMENDAFKDLVETIDQEGQSEPILLRRLEDGSLELVYGSRRRAACEHLGINVKALVISDLSDEDAFHMSVMENTNRENLCPIEDAQAVRDYRRRYPKKSQAQVGVVFGRSRQWVSSQESFAELPDEFAELCVKPWTITEGSTREFRVEWDRSTKDRSALKRKMQSLRREVLSKNLRLRPHQVSQRLLNSVADKKPKIIQIKNKDGNVVVEVKPASIKKGKQVREMVFIEGFTATPIAAFLRELAKDIEANPQ